MPSRLLSGLLISLAVSTGAGADEPAKPHDMSKMWQSSLARRQLSGSAVFDEHGTLWLARVQDGHVLVSSSADQGTSFAAAVRVNAQPEFVSASGETRPKILLAKNGNIYISWTQSLDTPYAGNIRFSRSLDGGKSFSAPLTVNDDLEPITHRFEAMGINARGHIYLAWLDKRDALAAKNKGEKYSGIAVYSAMSDDEGKSFHANIRVADHSCECCRVAMAIDSTDTPVIVWRHIFGKNVRDHGLAKLDGATDKTDAVRRVTFENWEVEACPHHGPALSISGDVYHMAWFNLGAERRGLFYAHSSDAGKTFSRPVSVGNSARQAGHAAVLSKGRDVYLAWKEFDGEVTAINAMRSHDGGVSWGAVQKIAETHDESDHPLLIADKAKVYLSWSSQLEGYRLIALPEEK
ncbi:MAG TPA: sialidase family protein [Gallionellaceae bacterium]|nr:sialidase family protein [Gallionellaceae bacterium]